MPTLIHCFRQQQLKHLHINNLTNIAQRSALALGKFESSEIKTAFQVGSSKDNHRQVVYLQNSCSLGRKLWKSSTRSSSSSLGNMGGYFSRLQLSWEEGMVLRSVKTPQSSHRYYQDSSAFLEKTLPGSLQAFGISRVPRKWFLQYLPVSDDLHFTCEWAILSYFFVCLWFVVEIIFCALWWDDSGNQVVLLPWTLLFLFSLLFCSCPFV